MKFSPDLTFRVADALQRLGYCIFGINELERLFGQTKDSKGRMHLLEEFARFVPGQGGDDGAFQVRALYQGGGDGAIRSCRFHRIDAGEGPRKGRREPQAVRLLTRRRIVPDRGAPGRRVIFRGFVVSG